MSGPAGDDLYADFVDEEHILAFQRALEAEEDFDTIDTPYGLSASEPSSPRQRVRKIAALSDFAPIRQRVNKKSRYQRKNREWSFHVVRWPFLTFLFIVIFAQFSLYVITRQIVNTVEWLFAWRGKKGALRKQMRSAKTYQEWKEAAKTMDLHLGLDKWKKDDEDPYYDWKLLKKVRRSLRSMREADDARGVLGILEICMRANFAASESSRLYSETYLGTKNLIESYINDIEASLAYVRQTTKLSIEEKRRFFRGINRNLGASALCLSGGATFGYYHFGVVKAFLDANLLPRVIAGTSCGSLIAALVCTRTDAELRKLLVPELADNITACEDPFRVWADRAWKTGARFDTVQWARKSVFFTRGSLTFREAYALTGRVLNVSVIPFDQHSPTKLLNYLTAPDCVIWSAIIASAAVPGILNPVVLMQKTKSGSIIPWNWGSRFKDGSLRVDVPLQSLHLLFNVNHSIVSQVNPHVHLFFFAPRGSAGKPVAKGKGWRGGFILSAAEQLLKHELTKNFKVIRDLELLPQLLGQDWSSVFLQRFDGTVTIWPRTRVKDWFRILSDPDKVELERMIRIGELATWPKLHMISNRVRLEREILRGRKAVRLALQVQTKASHEKEYTAPEVDRPVSAAPPVVPGPSEAEQLPIESDAETGFAAGAQRFFKRVHRKSHSTSPAGTSTDRPSLRVNTERAERAERAERGNTSSSGLGDEERGDKTPKELRSHEDPLVSPVKRRRWASSFLRVDDAHRPAEDEDNYFTGIRALVPKRSRGHIRAPTAPAGSISSAIQRGTSRTQPGSPVMGRRSPLLVRNQTHQQFTIPAAQPPGFFERLRTRSFTAFPGLNLVGRAGSSEPAAAFRANVSREGSFAAGGTEDSWSSDSSSEDEWSNTHLGQSVAGLATEAAHSLVGLSVPRDDSMDEDSPASGDEMTVRRKAEATLMEPTGPGEGEDHFTQDPKTGDLGDGADLPQQDEDPDA